MSAEDKTMIPEEGHSCGTRTTSPVDAAHWRHRLSDLIREHDVPGAALGILQGGQIVDAAAGVLSKSTLVGVTPDSLFQIGSITKVWTATLIMQLVDDGALALDTPVAEVLPEFKVANPEATKAVTVRHLLTHTSGIDGDVLTDTGRGDDCVKGYVAALRDVEQIHPVGETFSYCNSGFAIAGRIVEVMSGTTWDNALRERLIEPLRLSGTVTLPEDAILHRAAIGHIGNPGQDQVPTSVWMLPRGRGPAGRINATVHDVLAFVRMHIADSSTLGKESILSAASMHAMMQRQAAFPDHSSTCDSWGLGWMRFNWNGHRVIGHDGGTIGQHAFLRVLPAEGFAVALLTNGGDARGLYQDLIAETFSSLTNVTMPAPFAPPAEPVTVDVGLYEGRYRRSGLSTEVKEQDGALIMKSKFTGLLPSLIPGLSNEEQLVPVADGHFAIRQGGNHSWESVLFYALSNGRRYFHRGARANPMMWPASRNVGA